MRERFLPKSFRPKDECERKSMRCAWASILKSTKSLKPLSVVNTTSIETSSAVRIFPSGNSASAARSAARASAGVPANCSGARSLPSSEFTQLVDTAQANAARAFFAATVEAVGVAAAACEATLAISNRREITAPAAEDRAFGRKIFMVFSGCVSRSLRLHRRPYCLAALKPLSKGSEWCERQIVCRQYRRARKDHLHF